MRRSGLSARAYHGRMEADERSETQELFLDDHVRIVVATKAFGMGIDKPDVRYVVHYDVPATWSPTSRRPAGPAATANRPGRSCSTSKGTGTPKSISSKDSGWTRPESGRSSTGSAPWWLGANPSSWDHWPERRRPTNSSSAWLLFRLEEYGWVRREADSVSQASLLVLTEPDEWGSREACPAPIIAALAAIPTYTRQTVDVPHWASEIGVEVGLLDRSLAGLSVLGLVNYQPFGRALRYTPGPRFGPTPPELHGDDPLIAGKFAKLERMLAYGRSSGRSGCRRATLLRYLGQEYDPPLAGCGGCDACGVSAEVPWKDERLADVPNPSLLFDPDRVVLELIEANASRAREERRAPLGRQTLVAVLLGNAYAVLRHVQEPYLRAWKDRRLRSFRQWGLLASLPGGSASVAESFDKVVGIGWAREERGGFGDAGTTYTYLVPTEGGLRHLLSAARHSDTDTTTDERD